MGRLCGAPRAWRCDGGSRDESVLSDSVAIVTEGVFVPAVFDAFEGVVTSLGLEFVGSNDGDWGASVEWKLEGVQLRVTDDRRDRLIEVFVTRRARDDELETASLLRRDNTISLPLWAIVEATGASAAFYLSGASRLDRLPEYVRAVKEYAVPFLFDPKHPIDDVVSVVKRRNWESSSEGRRARRWLP